MTAKNALPSAPTGERNLGIDTLRLFAMLLIVTVHIYNRGGVLAGLGGDTRALQAPLRALCMTAANVYALISGFVMAERRFRPGRFLELWLQVVGIGLIECGIWSLCSPGAVRWENWRTALLPVTQYEYWYFTAFAGTFLLSPLLNRGLCALSPRRLKALMAGIFGLFSVGWLLAQRYFGDSFWLGGGYSTLWLILLYLLGGCLKRSGAFQKTPTLLLWLLAALTLATMCRLELRQWRNLAFKYCNPLTVTLSVLLLVLFARLRVRGFAAKLVAWLSPLSFGVYLIHVHPAAWSWMEQRYAALAKLPALWVLPAVLAAALGLYLCCTLLDWLRSLLFRLLRVRWLCGRAEEKLRKIWQ